MTEINVTVIGGYLGAGKTTLVNHLLREADEPVAVLVNDFGAINIDLDLIERRDDNTIELTNGCICCSMVDGFAEALDQIRRIEPTPARLVIEASGVADPAMVAAYGHGPRLTLDAVIVLVDAETIRTSVDDRRVGDIVQRQLASADILVVNKADLVETDALAATTDWLHRRHPDAFVLTSTHSRVPPEVLFGHNAPRGGSSGNDTGSHPPAADAQSIFTSTTWAPAEEQTLDQVDAFLNSLGDEVVRAKGLVAIGGSDRPYLVQRVGRRATVRRHAGDWAGERNTRVVIISTR